jgi:hypothetical protein
VTQNKLEALKEVVARAYDVFCVKPSLPLDVCAVCCMPAEEQSKLLSYDQRKMPEPLLYSWNHAAKTDFPDVRDFKYFLPRLLDLLSSNQLGGWSIELVFKSFRYYDMTAWTKAERDIMHDFKHAHFAYCLTTYKADVHPPISDVLAMWMYAGFAVTDLLHEWERETGSSQLMVLAYEIQHAGPNMKRNAFLKELAAEAGEIDQWFARWALALENDLVELGARFATGT